MNEKYDNSELADDKIRTLTSKEADIFHHSYCCIVNRQSSKENFWR